MPAIRFCLSSLWTILRCLLAAAIIFSLGGQPARAMGPLQDMIDAADPGDTVTLPAGTYAENLTINKNLVLQGDPVSGTTIMPPVESDVPAIKLQAGAAVVTLQNLTILGSSVLAGSGGGILAENSTLTVRGCSIRDNSALFGGGIYLAAGSLTIEDSFFVNNRVTYDGGAIFSAGPLTLLNTYIAVNRAGRHGGGVHGQGSVTITGGVLQSNFATGNGGGVNMNDDLVISGAQFLNNSAGGAGGGVLQWNADHNVTLTHVDFTGNTAVTTGGGLSTGGNNGTGGSVEINGGTFSGNVVGVDTSGEDAFGGGLYVSGASLTLHGTRFLQNKALCDGCWHLLGGGAAIASPAPVASLVENAYFEGNEAWFGGGLANTKRDADPTYASLTVLRSTFTANLAGYGGGLYGIYATVKDSLFENNTVWNDGGGINVSRSLLERLVVKNNHVRVDSSSGAGIYTVDEMIIRNTAVIGNSVLSANTTTTGIGIHMYSSKNSVLDQVTIAGNTGGQGSGLYLESGNATLKNAIVANQAMGVCSISPAGTLSIQGVLWYGNTVNTGSSPACTGTTSISDPFTGDPAFTADGYHITRASAAFNTALPSTVTDDIDGSPRPSFGLPDFGADELGFYIYLPAIIR